MRIIIVGPGRAGGALGLALARHHDLVGVSSRRPEAGEAAAELLGTTSLPWGESLPPADLVILAVRDDVIASVAEQLAPVAAAITAAVHISGIAPVGVLSSLAGAGLRTGSFHPLQTLPTAEAGAARLTGAWFAITAAEPLRSELWRLAETLGGHPFDLEDESKPLYHAAAAAAANFPLAALAMARDLFAAAGVPFQAAQPLVAAVVDNAFAMGPLRALTGPVVRGDVATVAGQLEAVRRTLPEHGDGYADLVDRLSRLVGNRPLFDELLT